MGEANFLPVNPDACSERASLDEDVAIVRGHIYIDILTLCWLL